jgi:lysophospholipase L1-like esterase
MISLFTRSQPFCDTLPFIECDQNKIIFHEADSNLANLIIKLQAGNSEKIRIVHIGDSHLQAGFLTEKIKQILFQHFSPIDNFASPGFLFPYTIAQTNNPFFYKVKSTGDWEWCKNVDKDKTCKLGLSGITIRTNSSRSTISIKMQNQKYAYPVKYFFDKVKLLYNTDSSIQITINGKESISEDGYSFVQLDNLTDSVLIQIANNDTRKYVELYGIILDNDLSKINYHTIGVNGATAQSYLKCDFLSDHLRIINPDLVILSLGTNEAYDKDFSNLKHEFELKDLIYQIRDISPKAAIILTTPNDHLKDGNNNNDNIQLVRDNIFKISNEFQLSIWDFYSIMGGENSIHDWYKKGLTGQDKLHFKRIGYEIQGELFAKALIDLIEKNGIK